MRHQALEPIRSHTTVCSRWPTSPGTRGYPSRHSGLVSCSSCEFSATFNPAPELWPLNPPFPAGSLCFCPEVGQRAFSPLRVDLSPSTGPPAQPLVYCGLARDVCQTVTSRSLGRRAGALTVPPLFHRYVSCALGCPYEGKVSPAKVAEVCAVGPGLMRVDFLASLHAQVQLTPFQKNTHSLVD